MKSAIILIALFVFGVGVVSAQETVILQSPTGESLSPSNPEIENSNLPENIPKDTVPSSEPPAVEEVLTPVEPVPLSKEQEQQLKDLETQLEKGEITQEEYELQKKAIAGAEASALRAGEPISPESQTVGKHVSPGVSAKDGSLTYQYKIIVPPGRDGLQPNLNLVYDSANRSQSSLVSMGWSFDIPFIQRLNKKGTDKLYTENHFMSSLDGELVSQGSGVYEPLVENGTFLKYQFANDAWTVTAKDGTQYVFGQTAQSRQANPADATKIFAWMLEKVTDTNGNTITHTYFKDQGQIYPDNIKYNQENTFEIRFGRVTTSPIITSSFSGFTVKNAFRINKVELYTGGLLSSKHDFTYVNTLLDKVQLTGYEGATTATFPETKFAYITNATSSGWSTSGIGSGFANHNEGRYADLNGDGLTDFIYSVKSGSQYISQAYINNGSSFVYNSAWNIPVNATNKWFFYDQGTSVSNSKNFELVDANADGLIDLSSYSTTYGGLLVYLNNNSNFGLLSQITSPEGGKNTISYITAQKNSNSNKVPGSVIVVKSITTDDLQNNTHTTQYDYKDARFYFKNVFDKKFAGFGEITKTNPDGSKVITKYHQANGQTGNEPTDSYAKIGKPYEEVTTNNSGSTWLKKRFAYTDTNIGTNASSSLLTSELTQLFDGTSNRTDIATTYAYDTYGNITTETKFGIVTGNADGTFTDTASDKRTIESTYVANTTDYIVGLPKSRVIKNNGGTQEGRTNYHYDVDGNLLEEGRWIAGTDYATTTYTYNSYGLTTSEKDALNNTTTYTYDTDNLYPATITKPLSQATTHTYDYSSGKPKTITDPNGKVVEYVYDGLDRLLTEKRTIGNGATEIVRTRAYNTTANPQYITDTLFRGATDTHESRTYLDGFGREIQKKAQYAGGWATIDMVYDSMGRTKKFSLPYHTASNAKSAATTNNNLLTVHTHDPVGRILTTTDARGVTTMVYSGLITTVTDAESNTKEYTTDAFNNLTQVKEFNNTTPYTTQYSYNTFDLLTSITDAEGNVRAVGYDGLGRRTSLQDLHAPADGTYGTYTFSYDDINLLSVTSSNGDVTSYTYDALNRVLTENSNSTAHTDITYIYDSCTNGIGYTCQVATNAATTSYTYYKQGTENTKTITLDGTNHTQSITYNRQNQPLTVTYPNSDSVAYTYTVDGLPGTVSRNSLNFSTATYGVHTKPVTITFANGLTTTNTYNANKLYELTSRLTENASSTDLQNLAYTYDNVGNILSITDTSVTDTKKSQSFTYDDLYRLAGVTTTNVASGTSVYTQSFAYSPVGNITNFNGTTLAYAGTSYANPHAATTVGGATQTYDNNGNLTNDATWTHAWDYRNRLTSSTNGANTAIYQYSHENARTKLTEAGETTYYPFSDYEITGGTPKLYLNLGDTPIATIEGAITTYLHTDHLGGTTITTNPSGVITQTLDYYPYGDTRLDTGTNDEDTQYTGYKKDDVTGLNYAGARYYNSSRGRFISQDPVFASLGNQGLLEDKTGIQFNTYLRNPQTHNSYAYAGNNPLKYTDKNGEFLLPALAIVWAATEISLTVYDAYDTVKTFNDQNATQADKAVSLGGLALGVALPGGGYGAGAKAGLNAVDAARISKANNWGYASALKQHTTDHAADFGLKSNDYEGYAKAANGFVQTASSGFKQGNTRYDSFVSRLDGKTYLFDNNTAMFAVRNVNGTVATAYKPKGGDIQKAKSYWNDKKRSGK